MGLDFCLCHGPVKVKLITRISFKLPGHRNNESVSAFFYMRNGLFDEFKVVNLFYYILGGLSCVRLLCLSRGEKKKKIIRNKTYQK